MDEEKEAEIEAAEGILSRRLEQIRAQRAKRRPVEREARIPLPPMELERELINREYKMPMREEKDQERRRVELTSVVSETQPAFKLPDGSVVNINEYLAWLGDMLYTIKRAVA